MIMASLRSRFQGAIVGALVGDCLGAYWERASWRGVHPIEEVRTKMEEQIRQTSSKKAPPISYTDDAALSLATAESLLECCGLDLEHMARRLTKEYFDDTRRGYGSGTATVFATLKSTKFRDLLTPAQEQFRGEGSCGNGGAMRISPVGLFGFHDDETLVEVCRGSVKITHPHPSGVNGALLQAMAVKLALKTAGDCDKVKFVDSLLEKMRPFEQDEACASDSQEVEALQQDLPVSASEVKVLRQMGQPTFGSRLQQLRALLTQQDPPSAYEVQALIGHGVLAAEAVPCAIYAFLHCSHSSFREVIPFSISLGGDADTIASMAGAIGGAFWGLEGIPPEWLSCCEESQRAVQLGDRLFDLTMELDNSVSTPTTEQS